MKNKITLFIIAVSLFIISCSSQNEQSKNSDTAAPLSKTQTEDELKQPASKYSLKETHKDFSCTDCHGEANIDEYYLITSDSCLSCHGTREDVAELTSKYDNKGGINPHNSFHLGVKAECYMCHQEHKPSRNYCSNCHDTALWMAPVP